jgi:aminomethyltransferase
MAGRPDHDGLFVVVNAGNKDEDFAFWEENLQGDAKLTVLDRALIAIQGPEAAEVMAAHEPILAEMGFMECARLMLFGADCYVSRSGYTGEDGYEISVPADQAERIWNTICWKTLASSRSAWAPATACGWKPACRYTATTSTRPPAPVEAALTFALSKSRKERGDFAGADRILKELSDGPSRVRVGLIVKEGAPAREGAEIADADGNIIGKVTSGGPSPTLGKNIAMGYVPPALRRTGRGPEGHRARQDRRRRSRRHALRGATLLSQAQSVTPFPSVTLGLAPRGHTHRRPPSDHDFRHRESGS